MSNRAGVLILMIAVIVNSEPITENDIDELMADGFNVLYYEIIKKHEQIPVSNEIMTLNLTRKDVNLIFYFNDSYLYMNDLKYFHSNILTDNQLTLKINTTTSFEIKGTIIVVGTLNGKEIIETGSFDLIWKEYTQNVTIILALEPESIAFTNSSYTFDLGNQSINIFKLQLEGIAKSELEETISEGIVDSLLRIVDQTYNSAVQDARKLKQNSSLQEICNRLRKMINNIRKETNNTL